MTLERTIVRTGIVVAVVLTIGALPATHAQGRGAQAPRYRSAAGAKDLRAVHSHWTGSLGMLRGQDEHELVASLEYQGKGTIQVDAQPCTLTNVSGEYASNDDIPGAGIDPDKGKATPMPAAVQERLIRLWASPPGAPKAVLAGVTDPPVSGANPGQPVPDGLATAGKTSVSREAGKPLVTFPIPGVPGAIATATLNAKYMAKRMVVKQGSTTTEITCRDYQDWNNPLNKTEGGRN
jgi:hypothetical protein